MSRRGDVSAIGVMISLALGIALFIVIFYGPIDSIKAASDTILGCKSTCTSSCDFGDGIPYAPGDSWCEKGDYDVTGITKYTTMIDKYNGNADSIYNGISKKGAWGKALNLECCIARGDSPPEYFLQKSLRVGEHDERTSSISGPPKIEIYFSDRPKALNNGERVYVVSDKEHKLRVTVKKRTTEGTLESITCTSKLLDKTGRDLFTVVLADSQHTLFTKKYFDQITTLKNSFKDTCGTKNTGTNVPAETNQYDITNLLFPSEFEGEEFSLIITATQPKGSSKTALVSQRSVVFLVSDQVKIEGLTSKWAYQRTVTVSCVDTECVDFKYDLLEKSKLSDGCPKTYTNSATNTGPNRAEIIVAKKGAHYLCIQAQSKAGEYYTKRSSIPVQIDHTPPTIDPHFNFLTLTTEVVCYEPRASGSGCASAVGYYYIYNPLSFVTQDCASEHTPYQWIPAERVEGDLDSVRAVIPYRSNADIGVLCVRVKDEAGNIDEKAVVTYNVIGDFVNTLSGQINTGYNAPFGYGQGYGGII